MSEQEKPQVEPTEEIVAEEVVENEAEQATETQQEEMQEQDKDVVIADLQKKLAEAEAKVDAQKDAVFRARADADNIRRRAAQDVEKAHKFALEKFAQELLPVLDNLERALQAEATVEDAALKSVLEGVELTQKSFLSSVEKFGIEKVDPMGEAFNPELHQAMTIQESADHEPNTVIAVFQKGYQLNGRLLRPAMVVVSKASA